MSFVRYFIAICIACLMTGWLVQAQQANTVPSSAVVPRLVNFSGKATDAQGRVISGISGMTFAIYKEQYEGSPLWLETQNIHADAKGNYTVQLGAASAEGIPLDLFSTGEARWLGVTVNGGKEQARVLLLSVPYALKAADAETIGGLPPSAFVRANPEELHAGESSSASNSVPSLSPASANSAQPGNLLTVKTSSPGATVGFIPLWAGNKSPTIRIGSSLLFQSGTSLGLGTTSPLANLDVFSSTAGVHDPMGRFGSNGATDGNAIQVYTGALSGTAESEVFVSGGANEFVPGTVAGDGGIRVAPGAGMSLGDAQTSRLKLDSKGNASQPRTAGGTVKALALVDQTGVIRCFNSTLFGSAATTPPCGFLFDETGPGDYIIDFSFQVNDRFVSATPGGANGWPAGGPTVTACVLGLGGFPCNNTVTKNQVEVTNFCAVSNFFCSAGYHDNEIFVIIY